MKTSPMLATLGSTGSGIGTRSPKGPAMRRNCASSVSGRSTWKVGTRSAVVKPTSARDGSQTGIQPPLTTTAKAFEATPTMTTSIPGTARLCQSAISSSPKAPPKSGRRSVSAMATPLAMASSVP